MKTQVYFYEFLESFSFELAEVAHELELSIYSSPRTMLTHSRTFVDVLLQNVMKNEKLSDFPFESLKERIDKLDANGLLSTEVKDAVHIVRKKGNQAAHQTRSFRFSEALMTWEALYVVVKWYIEVYCSKDYEVPIYLDPQPKQDGNYDKLELEFRLDKLEELLKISMRKEIENNEVAATNTQEINEIMKEEPGFTSIRKIYYEEESFSIPYFLRDAFLLPQRFNSSTTFLVRLSAEQQGRIMSEIPQKIKGFHKYVKRFNETADKRFFEELKVFVEEEKTRRKVVMERPGELFLFYKAEYVVVTKELGDIELTTEIFHSIPSLIKQLKKSEINTVGQLPKELVILGKYENVGVNTVEKLFNQLVLRQNKMENT